MSTDTPECQRYRFGPFTLDTASFQLTRGATDVALTPKAFELLALLVRERHRALTKQELLDAVWPETAVIENTLTQRIKEIREALGDNAHDPGYVRTVPRVGFQFIAETSIEPAVRPASVAPPEAVTATAPPPAGVADEAPATRRRAVLAVFAIAALIAAGAFLARVWRGDWRALPGAGLASGRVMLAVLPFENLGADPEQGYLSDGLTEELIAEFGRLDPTGLGVIARTSAMSYKGTTKSVALIAKELGVDYIFEGSVRREGDRVRIVAQLIRASDQTHVWADRYDRDLGSVLGLQTEVARQIAAQTRIRLSAAASARLGRTITGHPEAYQAYLRGRFFLNQRTGGAIEKAVEQFRQAIAIDPAYAQAHAGLADAYELLASYANITPRDFFDRSLQSAHRALELDPELAEPYASLGTIHTSYTWDWIEAERAYRRALELNPSSAEARKGYGELLSFLGRHDQAIVQLTRATALDPVALVMHANLGIVYWRARRYDEAMQQMTQTLNMNPNYMLGHLNVGLIQAARGEYDAAAAAFRRASEYSPRFGDPLGLLGHAHARAGRIEEARAVGDELRRLSAETYVSAYIRALYHLGLEERELALDELERAYDERSWLVAMVKVDPMLDALRSEPRFQALVQRLRFPE
jgi:TolB-like protein/DNA-binding winged helix-turn-helix (wHTH) protein/Tfp pilus assembly protein PilF